MRGLALVLLLFSLPAAAETVTVAFSEYRPPFLYVEDNQPKGIEWEVVNAAFAHTGIEVQPVYMANRRLLAAGTLNIVDGATQAKGQDDGSTFYSDPYVTFENYAITRKSAGLKIDSIKDLERYDFAIWQDGWNNLGSEFLATFGPDMNGKKKPKMHEFVDQKSQSRFFWQGRCEVIVIDKTIFRWARQALASELDTGAEVTYHDLFKSKTNYQVRFASKALRDKFNLGLHAIHASGEYDRIVATYTVSHP